MTCVVGRESDAYECLVGWLVDWPSPPPPLSPQSPPLSPSPPPPPPPPPPAAADWFSTDERRTRHHPMQGREEEKEEVDLEKNEPKGVRYGLCLVQASVSIDRDRAPTKPQGYWSGRRRAERDGHPTNIAGGEVDTWTWNLRIKKMSKKCIT